MSRTGTLAQKRKFSNRLKRFRKKHKLTQAELSALIELDRTELNRIENLHRYPYYTTIQRFEALEKRMNGQ